MSKITNQEIDLLINYANNDLDIWSRLLGCSLVSNTYGEGTINDISINKYGTYLEVSFLNGKKCKFNVSAFSQGYLTDLHIPEILHLEIVSYYDELSGYLSNRYKEKKEKEIIKLNEHLEKYNIKSLYYISHINNLSSIIEKGFFCRNLLLSNGIETTDISNERVQSRRMQHHQYVNFYIADNTPMLYVVIREHQDRIVLIEVDSLMVMVKRIRITDGNAASSTTTFYDDKECLCDLDWNIIKARRGAFTNEHKRIRAAEVLIENHVEPCCIKCVHVQSATVKEEARRLINRSGNEDISILKDLTINGIA